MTTSMEGVTLTVTSTLIVVCFVLTVIYLRHCHQYWQQRGVPCPPAPLLIGHTLARLGLTRPFTEFFDEVYYKYNGRDYCGFYDFLKPSLFVGNPQLIKSILVQDFQHFADRRTFDLAKVSPVANDMLTNARGSHWRKVRSAVSPAFTKTRTRRLYPLLLQRTQHLVQLVHSLNQEQTIPTPTTFTDTFVSNCQTYKQTQLQDTKEIGTHTSKSTKASFSQTQHTDIHDTYRQRTHLTDKRELRKQTHKTITKNVDQNINTITTTNTERKKNNHEREVINNSEETCSEDSKQKDTIEMRTLCGRYTMDAIASCAFGLECEALDNDLALFPIMAARVFQLSITRALKMLLLAICPRAANTAHSIGMRFTSDEFLFFLQVAKHALGTRRDANTSRGDFVDLLLEASANSKQELSDDTLAAQAILFLLAGYENTANTLAMSLHLLAHHPQVQATLRREVGQALLRNGSHLQYDEVTELPYLDAVVSETLRLYPAAPVIERVCTEPCRLGKVEVTVGTAVVVPVWCLHRDPTHWPQPKQFIPERFLKEARHTHTPFTYLPFGTGPRSCVGIRFAQVVVKVGLIAILSSANVVPNPTSPYPPVLDPRVLSLHPKNGLYVNLKPTSLSTLLLQELEEYPPTNSEDRMTAVDLQQLLTTLLSDD